MPESLTYASPATHPRRWSRLSFCALVLGLIGAPAWFGLCYLLFFIDVTGMSTLFFGLPLLVALPIAGIACCLLSLRNIGAADGRLRGFWLALAGGGLSVCWPIYMVHWIISQWPRC